MPVSYTHLDVYKRQTFIFPIVDNLSIMAKSEIFKNKLLAKLFRRYRVFPVNRERCV